jgi:hypothetical protein
MGACLIGVHASLIAEIAVEVDCPETSRALDAKTAALVYRNP